MIKITFRTMWKILTVRIKRLYCCVKKHPKVVITPLVFSVNCHLDVPFSKFHFTFAEDRYYQAVETTTIELRESRNSRNQPWIQNDLKLLVIRNTHLALIKRIGGLTWIFLPFSSSYQFYYHDDHCVGRPQTSIFCHLGKEVSQCGNHCQYQSAFLIQHRTSESSKL